MNPTNGAAGIYDKLLPIVQRWKASYNFVGSYYIDIANVPPDQGTDWSVSGAYYRQLLALGNELGSAFASRKKSPNVRCWKLKQQACLFRTDSTRCGSRNVQSGRTITSIVRYRVRFRRFHDERRVHAELLLE